MRLKNFIEKSGFKVLAMARLTQCEYSLVLYLVNCAASGLDQVVTTEAEFASLIGYDALEVAQAFDTLASRQIVRLRYSDHVHTEQPSVRLGLEYDISRWHLNFDEDATVHDAVVYPFMRRGRSGLSVLEGEAEEREIPADKTSNRVLDSFLQGRSLDDEELGQAEASSKILLETHPVDQVLLMLRHFGQRIPTLSLLASSWQHYQEMFESETQQIDMLEARQKHNDLDEGLRKEAGRWLEDADKHDLSNEERGVLRILVSHRHPRRQLFWAYQLRNRYKNLGDFFQENISVMLPVTSAGVLVKRPT